MMLTREQAENIVQKILAASKADAVRIEIDGGQSSNLRFARNEVSTSGASSNVAIQITSTFGKKSGSYSLNQFNEKTIGEAVKRSEELAQLAPEDPEYMDPVGPQEYPAVRSFVEGTATLAPAARAAIAKECIDLAIPKKLTVAGFIENGAASSMFANNKGLSAFHTSTSITYSVTARTEDGTGSGWAGGGHMDAGKMDGLLISKRAVEKAVASMNPQPLEPGKYTVILEPEAVANLLQSFVFRLDARNADEGRSFFSDPGGGNKIGQRLFPEFVNIVSDPTNPDAPGFPWSEDGLPSSKTVWVENGVLKNLRYSRFWAGQKGKQPLPFPSNTLMQGGTATVDELIASTQRGILVTRFWYIRDVDPKTMLLTGLTRDGSFLVENGKIIHPVKNFRFNESPVTMLKNIETMGKPERMQRGGSADLIPALKVREFTFSSLSDAV